MKKICYINGRYLTNKISGGVKRFAIEVVKRLKEETNDIEFIVLCPKDAIIPSDKKGITYKKIGFFKDNLWEQISLAIFMRFHKGYLFNPCNSYPILINKNVVVFHDARPKEEINDGIVTKTAKKFDYMLSKSIKKKNLIFTDSNFSKKRIMDLYKCDGDNIKILRLGYEHCIINSNSILDERLESLIKKEYYLTVNSISKHKNMSFIYSLAKLHTDKLFYVIGKQFDSVLDEIPSNLVFLGKLSDSVMAEFYKNSLGFISPSLYEGFGLTPLEALYYGCPTIYLSDIEVFREIFSLVAVFFDPYNYEKFEFIEKKINDEDRKKVLNNYNWTNCVKDILEGLNCLKW